MGFEKFTQRRHVFGGEPKVTIMKVGIFGINQECHKQYFSGNKYAILYYDCDSKRIGIQPTNTSDDAAYPIRVFKGGSVIQISATAFLKYYNILPKETKTFTCAWNDEEKLVEIQL